MDQIWHHLISETQEYRHMCHRLQPGNFIDHTSIEFDDYAAHLGGQTVVTEQLSWLANYVAEFGNFEPGIESVLTILPSMAAKLECSVSDLSKLGRSLAGQYPASRQQKIAGTLSPHLFSILEQTSLQSQKDAVQATATLDEFWAAFRKAHPIRHPLVLTPQELFDVYGASATLGFTLAQHHSAFHRLSQSPEWQQSNVQLWQEIESGRSLCALATTHLANPEMSLLNGVFDPGTDEWIITGRIPWVSGIGFYSQIVLGFRADQQTVICCISIEGLRTSKQTTLKSLQLAFLNGTASHEIAFSSFRVASRDVVSSKLRPAPNVNGPRVFESPYNFSQLGLASKALDLVERYCASHAHPHNNSIQKQANNLRSSLNTLTGAHVDQSSQTAINSTAHFERDECIRRSVRLLALTQRGSAISQSSEASRVLAESFLFDAVIQSGELIQTKLFLL